MLKDLVAAWDLLIRTAQENQGNPNICEIRTHNTNLNAVRDENEVALPFSGLSLNGYGRKGKIDKNQKYMSHYAEQRKGINSNNGKISDNDLLKEETYRYDLVEVTRELMQVGYKHCSCLLTVLMSFIRISCRTATLKVRDSLSSHSLVLSSFSPCKTKSSPSILTHNGCVTCVLCGYVEWLIVENNNWE